MRFAYIDSQGNEVSIPSVDALALRIELGAITADTELYDAQADRWGPANTHDIFHTLSRDAEEEGFVAPPPAMAPAPPALAEPAESGPEAEEAPGPAAGAEAAPEPEAASEAVEEPVSLDFGGGLELAGDPSTEEASVAGESPEGGFGEGMGLDLSPIPDAEALVDEHSGDGEEGGGFDFGDFSGGLELEPTVEDDPETVSADVGAGVDAPMDFSGGGMELESPMDFAGDEGDGGPVSGGIELEKPMSEYTPDSPPQWMEESGPDDEDQDEAAIDFGARSPAVSERSPASSGDREERPLERPKPRSRPSPPRRPRRPLPIGMIVGALVVLGGGAAGFMAWQSFGGVEVVEVPALPPVVIPDIPAELLPQMRDLAEAAIAEMLDDLRGRSAALDIPSQPRDEWLGGSYLANASQFGDIEQFWVGIERFVDEVRSTDTQLFHDKYVQQVEVAGIAADEAAMLIERADSGFVAARDGRFEAYNLMDDLLNAALDLHVFLLDNEQEIAHEPAIAGMSRDPVLEAVPSTPMLKDEMWGLVGGITDALSDLGTLDRVTRERLFAVLFDRIRRAGIQ